MFSEEPTRDFLQEQNNGLQTEKAIENEEENKEKVIIPPKKSFFDKKITDKEKIQDIKKVGQTTLQREMVICLRRIVKNLDILCLVILSFFIIWTTKNFLSEDILSALFTGIAAFLLGLAQIILPKGRWAEQVLFKLLKKNLDNSYRTIEGDN